MSSTRLWALVPAAGSGRRMNTTTPKQYLTLAGRTVIEHSLTTLLHHPRISAAMVVLDPLDDYWPELPIGTDNPKPVWTSHGGDERQVSVLNGLNALRPHLSSLEDWVLVHDAARPCLSQSDLDRLINTLEHDEVGGLLASPVRDTMKRADHNERIQQTESRDGLWHALTPQMFRFRLLHQALTEAATTARTVTDEASAIEALGLAPRLVQGSRSNIKITLAEDLPLAEFYLSLAQSHNKL